MPGTVTLIGSGETANTGGQVFDSIARRLAAPLHISILETPAGFETNASRVADRVASYLDLRLSNHRPRISQIEARKKGTHFSPDSPEIVRPLYDSNLIFFGPGSPTYTVRQLQDSLTWQVVQARHRLGASLVLASAATIAVGAFALPVYEIFKVGEDPHWKPGLDLFGAYGISLAIIPHWNNNEGGEDVDTSRCFIGQDRFQQLIDQLPPGMTVLGIDEHTAVTLDFESLDCHVMGVGQVHLLQSSGYQDCAAGCDFPIQSLGDYHPLSAPDAGLPSDVWQLALNTQSRTETAADGEIQPEIPKEVQRLVDAREEARKQRAWNRADQLREQITALGWQISDSPSGPVLSYSPHCTA